VARTRAKLSRSCALLGVMGVSIASGVGALAMLASPRGPALGTRELCAQYTGIPAGLERDPHSGMVFIAGGMLTPGSVRGYAEERGGTDQPIAGFWIDRTEVTNAQFARFVAATGHVTQAERSGAAPVFHRPSPEELAERDYAWWRPTAGADWRHPERPSSHMTDKPNHPVVQVTQADALAYARWLGRVLPTEAQWEYAAKANRDSEALHREPRGPHGEPLANFWQGDFPRVNTLQDGFETSAPVGCFAANPLGLYDVLGNVWEWTGSRYTSSHRAQDQDLASDGAVAAVEGCSAPAEPGTRLTLKGGSFLCAANFCARYRVAARHAQEAEQPAMHIGFRTALVEPSR